MNSQKRAEIFARFARANPDPTTELKYRTPYELLVAVILSAQATDKSVNAATAELFKVADTPSEMLALGLDGLIPYIRTIGLFNTKAKNLIATSRLLVERYGGEVPATREALEQLPGVGRKTANVILNTAFGQDTIAVDTHIFRVANRARAAEDPARGREPPAQARSRARSQERAPRAHPARPLRVSGPEARLPGVPHPGSVRVHQEDARSRRSEAGGVDSSLARLLSPVPCDVQPLPGTSPAVLFRRLAQVPGRTAARGARADRARSDARSPRVPRGAGGPGTVPRPRLRARGRAGESVPAHEPARRDRGAARDRSAAGHPHGVRAHPRAPRRPARRIARGARMSRGDRLAGATRSRRARRGGLPGVRAAAVRGGQPPLRAAARDSEPASARRARAGAAG